MENKKYHLSKGNNLGQNQYLQKDENLTSFVFQGTIQNIYNDPEIIWQALHTTNYYAVLQNSNEFKEWAKTEEAEDCTKMEYLKKVLSFMPNEILGQVKIYIENKKKEDLPLLTIIENLYKSSLNPKDVYPIEISEGFAKLENRKVLLHNIPLPTSADEIDSRKDLGFLASEWFGKLEHRKEDRFCASFMKYNGLEPKISKNEGMPQLTFIFDAESEGLKNLLKVDLFQYCRDKQNNNLDNYTKKEINFLENLLQWSCGAMSISKKEPTWVAVPGGVSSDYVIGIIANNIEENSKEMETAIQIAQKFNVPLLKPDLTVIYGNILNV